MADREGARREPSFGEARQARGPSRDDIRLSADDRAVPQRGRQRERGERDREDDDAPRRRGRGGPPAPKGRRRKPRRSLFGRLAYWTLVLGLWAVMGLGGLIAYHAAQLPPIDQLTVPKRPPNIAILAADGVLIANRGETGGRNVNIRELPPHLPRAFIAIEDRRFYNHFGLDPVGIVRATVRNLTSRGVSQGGSTLTQQLAKNLFLTQDRTMSRKIQEAILAVWLERSFSKDQILELYLNRVYFGSGAYGVEAAAQRYFGKSARSVSVAEAAMLAGLVQAPSRLAPNRNPEAAERRAQMVIAAMVDQGFISDSSAKTALVQPAEAVEREGANTIAYAADFVMDVLDDFIGSIDGDVTVLTSIDPRIQLAAEAALTEALNREGAKQSVSQGAVVAMLPDGAIQALVGGRSYARSQFNRAASARRQPGSSFKPFVYLAALEAGLTPDAIRDDSPVTVKGWSPENYSRDYRGPVSLQTALSLSLNTVAVKLGQEVGPKAVVRVAQRLGIASPLQANASLPLGTSEVTPLELTAAYAAFANGGQGVTPYVIREVRAASGKVLYKRDGSGIGTVVDRNRLPMMNGMLRETLLTGTGRKADVPGWEAAGKTGTTQDFRDAWFVGYTSRLVAAVWLGNDDNSPMKRVSGGGLPSEIWGRFMRTALGGAQPLPLPGGLWRTPPDASGAPMANAAPVGSRRAGAAPATTHDNDVVRSMPPGRGLLERLFGG
ncbi:MAG: PBP1A family penicillin-binding protein [Hyphomicrobiales bacterium]|nr:PBP1A family penicillin-binding protein [Hyphomicrobiales bacterium]